MGAADLSQSLGSAVSSGGAPDLFLILAAAMSWPRSRSFSGEPKRVFWVLKQETEQVVPFWSGGTKLPLVESHCSRTMVFGYTLKVSEGF